VCLTTIKAYANNAKSNPTESKYHRIKRDNKAFKERVAPLAPESEELLRAMGFKDVEAEPEVFAIQSSTADGWLLGEGIKFMDLVLNKL